MRYMSPEQREGQPADQAWDIWALAVTTYEMLTGSHLFEDGNRDRFAAGPVIPFKPVATYISGEVKLGNPCLNTALPVKCRRVPLVLKPSCPNYSLLQSESVEIGTVSKLFR